MAEIERIWTGLVNCRPTRRDSGYEQFEEFKEFSKRNPADAYDMAWRRIVEFDCDDEGQLTIGLLVIMAQCDSERLRSQVREAWGGLSDEKRARIANSAFRDDVLPLCDWICLFVDDRSSVRVRHLLLGKLFGGAYSEPFRHYARSCVQIVGDHTDHVRSQMLREAKAKVLAYYGISDSELGTG